MTICAISTPNGTGGIAVIRVSGPDTVSAVSTIFRPKNEAHVLCDRPSYSMTFGSIVQPGTGEAVDEVVVSLFRAPHSFTGEDVVEISCHGSLYIQQEILKLLVQAGCQLARPGEFTQRAFLNGKMDLSQAEAVADVIASTSAAANRLAMNHMRGGFSTELNRLREKLLNFTSLVELELDFSEEEVEFADRGQLRQLADEIHRVIEKLCNSFALGNAIKNGIPVAIVGETNVGKSTLLNLLLNEDRAIVSDIHGTTRDTLEDTVNLNGIQFRFIDTAGIRDTTDAVENMGIERTYQKIEQARIILWLVDCTAITEHIEWLADRIIRRSEGKKLIIVFNKIDKIEPDERQILEHLFQPYPAERIYISAKKQINTDELTQALIRAAQMPEMSENEVIVTNLRHYEALKNALQSITQVQEGLQGNIPGDLLAQDIRECMHYLGEITGQISTDEILGNIFGKFCIGK